MKRVKKGFTLIEIMIAIIIIGVISIIAIPIVVGVSAEADIVERKAINAELNAAVDSFKSTEVNSISKYPRLYQTDISGFVESDAFVESAGKDEAPGFTVELSNGGVTKSSEEIYNEIRREFMLSVKAFTELEVRDDYYLADKYKSNETVLVYYYLTGDIKDVNIYELKYYDGTNTAINSDEYWVFLTEVDVYPVGREGQTGSGFAGVENHDNNYNVNEGVDSSKLNFYVKVVDFVTGDPLVGINVRIVGGEERKGVTGDTGVVQFLDVVAGTYVVHAEDKNNWLTYPDNHIYTNSNEANGITAIVRGSNADGSLKRYVGDYIQNAYTINMKRGTLGSMEFTVEFFDWNGSNWIKRTEILDSGIYLNINFNVNPAGQLSAINQDYVFNTAERKLTFLQTKKFLTYGKYTMSVNSQANKYIAVTKQIESKIWGIDDLPVNTYGKPIKPYTYVQPLKRTYSVFRGKVVLEETEQIIKGVPSESGKQGHWDEDSSVPAPGITTKIRLKKNGTVKYSGTVNEDGTFEIDNIVNDTYDIDFSNEYNSSFLPDGFPSQLKAENAEYEADGVIKSSHYKLVDVEFSVLFDDNDDPIQGAKVTIQRYGESTKETKTVDNQGKVKFSGKKTGYYQVSYTVPYNNTVYYAKIFVPESGKYLKLYPVLLKSTIQGSLKDEYGVIPKVASGNIKITIKNLETGTTMNDVVCSVTADGKWSANIRVGTYSVVMTTSIHYESTKTIYSSVKLFDPNKSHLIAYSLNNSSTVIFSKTNESRHNSKVIYRKGDMAIHSGDNEYHERYCVDCGYHWAKVACTFNKNISANVASITDAQGGITKHRVTCEVCQINKQDQLHVFTGNYKNITAHTQVNNGAHNRKCLYCTDYGYDNGGGHKRNDTYPCSNTTTIGSNTHNYKCNECSSNKTYDHNYNQEYRIVGTKTSASTGTHYRLCYGCDSYGWDNVKDKTVNCSNSESSIDSKHTHTCNLCNNTITENHNFNGVYSNVESHTSPSNGKHKRKCFNCTSYGFNGSVAGTENCSNTTSKGSSTHNYKCNECSSNSTYSHQFNGTYKISLARTTATNGNHQRLCSGCDGYGSGGTLNATTACSSVESTTASKHKFTCSSCGNNLEETHNFNGAYKNVASHTTETNGTHYQRCFNCSAYGAGSSKGATVTCSNTTTSAKTTHTYKCNECKSSNTLSHSFTGDYVNKTAHTSATNGKHNRKCTGCTSLGMGSSSGATESCGNNTTFNVTQHTYTCPSCKSANSINHSFTGTIIKVTDPSSSTSGTHKFNCKGCTATGYNGSTSSTEACTVGITKNGASGHTFKCSKCKNSKLVNHVYETPYPEPKEKCLTAGVYKKKCSICEYITKDRNVPATGHSWGTVYTTTKEPNCTDKGSKYLECVNDSCTAKSEYDIDATGHSWGLSYDNPSPTCTLSGKKEKKCSKCGKIEVLETLPSKGHDMGSWYQSQSATCQTSGRRKSVCNRSGCSHYVEESTGTVGCNNNTMGQCNGCNRIMTAAGTFCSWCGKSMTGWSSHSPCGNGSSISGSYCKVVIVSTGRECNAELPCGRSHN